MDQRTQAQFEMRARIIKALAHPSRLFIVDRLSKEKECSVQELTGLIEADISTVSKHLSVLKNVGIIRDEKRGTSVFYSLSVPCVLNFFSCVEAVISSTLKQQTELMK